jgi:hypothetical protein
MKVYVQMPMDTPFKPGDIVLERGFEIKAAEGEKAVHEDISGVFLRPASTRLAAGSDPAKALEISSRLQSLAKEIEAL